MRAAIRVGTSGWEYSHWSGSFYPLDLPRDRRLEFYAERFDSPTGSGRWSTDAGWFEASACSPCGT